MFEAVELLVFIHSAQIEIMMIHLIRLSDIAKSDFVISQAMNNRPIALGP
jgi:hypothetical protein